MMHVLKLKKKKKIKFSFYFLNKFTINIKILIHLIFTSSLMLIHDKFIAFLYKIRN
jgi:hypothetical protein